MDTETVELEVKPEEASPNGHNYRTFDDDQALLNHIVSKAPAEELVEIPEWEVQILCRALPVPDRIAIEIACYDEKTKRTDYRKDFYKVCCAGCFNPQTGKKVFTESKRTELMRHGGPIIKLALTVLRLSGMWGPVQENIRKN